MNCEYCNSGKNLREGAQIFYQADTGQKWLAFTRAPERCSKCGRRAGWGNHELRKVQLASPSQVRSVPRCRSSWPAQGR
jgi:hypothetical protein